MREGEGEDSGSRSGSNSCSGSGSGFRARGWRSAETVVERVGVERHIDSDQYFGFFLFRQRVFLRSISLLLPGFTLAAPCWTHRDTWKSKYRYISRFFINVYSEIPLCNKARKSRLSEDTRFGHLFAGGLWAIPIH